MELEERAPLQLQRILGLRDASIAQITPRVSAILTLGTRAVQGTEDEALQARGASCLEGPHKRDPSARLKDWLPELLEQDVLAHEIKDGLSNPGSFILRKGFAKSELQHWSLREGLLYRRGRLYIPDHHGLKLELLAKFHDDPLAGHFATSKTRELVERKFYWIGLADFVNSYCQACGVCQGARVIRGKQQGLLEPLPVPSQIWEQVTMDMVTDLPASVAVGSLL